MPNAFHRLRGTQLLSALETSEMLKLFAIVVLNGHLTTMMSGFHVSTDCGFRLLEAVDDSLGRAWT